MNTITTCTTADLDRLIEKCRNPQTLEESAILEGAKAELAERRHPLTLQRDKEVETASRRRMKPVVPSHA